jgi:hypothetical protein
MKQKITVSLSIIVLLLSISPVFTPFASATCRSGSVVLPCPSGVDTSTLFGKPTPLVYGQIYQLLNKDWVIEQELRGGELSISLTEALVAITWANENGFSLLDKNANYIAKVGETNLPKIYLDHTVDQDQLLSIIPTISLIVEYFGVTEFRVEASSLNFYFQGKKVVLPIYVSDPKLLVAKVVLVFSQLNDTLQKTTMSSRDNKSIMEVDFRFDDPVLISK